MKKMKFITFSKRYAKEKHILLSDIKEIYISHTYFQNLEDIQELRSLEDLTFEYCHIDNFDNISNLKCKIKALRILNCKVNNFASIKELELLEELEISDSGDFNLECIHGLSNLKRLTLIACNICDISELSSHIELEELALVENRINDISIISNLPKINKLSIDSNNLEIHRASKTMTVIRNLELGGCSVSYIMQNFCYEIPDLPKLEENDQFLECLNPLEMLELPRTGGLYFFYGSDKSILYVGQTDNILNRIRMHLIGNTSNRDIFNLFKYVKYIVLEDNEEREIYETYYINTLKPPLNVEKVYTYKSERLSYKYQYPYKWEKF